MIILRLIRWQCLVVEDVKIVVPELITTDIVAVCIDLLE